MPTDTTTHLLWNEAGKIGCTLPGHAPHRESSTWALERWRVLTLNDRVDFAAELGHSPECAVCTARAQWGGDPFHL